MRIFGLTGGIASGKSTVAAMLRELGAAVIDADELAREVVEPGQPALAQIAKRWPDCITPEGRLDRARLGSRIFQSPDERRELEFITHPAIQENMVRRTVALEAEGKPIAIYEAALIFERGLERGMEAVILVVASRETQLRRIQSRDGLSEVEARRRLAAQLSPEEKAARAQYLIDTDQPLEQTRKQVAEIWKAIQDTGP
jgi:dephospho-CoA kinase